MNVSDQCIDFVKGFEGFNAHVYNDMVGIPTLGYGMTGIEIRNLASVTETQATTMLKELINRSYATPINNDLVSKGVTLNQNEFDALCSMAYNIGTTGLLTSTLYRNVCKGFRDRPTILADFQMWDKAGGNTVQGLLRRRTAEAEMFLTTNIPTVNNIARSVQAMCIKQGENSRRVSLLQAILNVIFTGSLKVDGDFGPGTKTIVIRYQKAMGLSADGIVGVDTISMLMLDIKNNYFKL